MTGPLHRNSTTKVGDVTDGTSQTYLVGERVFGGSSAGPYWAGLPGPASNQTSCWAGLVTAHLRALHQPTLPFLNGHWVGFSSRHPGGVQVVLCDGSVQFVAEDTEIFILGSMLQIQDGNVLNDAF